MTSKYDDYWAGRADELAGLVQRFVNGEEATLPVDDLKAVGRRKDWSGFAVINEGQVERAHDVNTRALAHWLLAHHQEAFSTGRHEVRVTRQRVLQLDPHRFRAGHSAAPNHERSSVPTPQVAMTAVRSHQSLTTRLPSMLHARSDDVRDLLQDVQGLDQLQQRLDRLTATDKQRPVDHDHREAVAFLDQTSAKDRAEGPAQPPPETETTAGPHHAPSDQADPSTDGDPDADAGGPLGEADLYAPLLARRPTPHAWPPPTPASTLPASALHAASCDPYVHMLPPFSAPGPAPCDPDPYTGMLPPSSAREPAPTVDTRGALQLDPYRHMVSPWLDDDPTRTSHRNQIPAEDTAQTPDPMAGVRLAPPFSAAMQDLLDGGSTFDGPPKESNPLRSIVAVIHRMVDVLPVVEPPFDPEALPEKALYLFHEHGRVFHEGRDHPRITHIGAPKPPKAHQTSAGTSEVEAEGGSDDENETAEESEMEWTGSELQGQEQVLVAASPADPDDPATSAETAAATGGRARGSSTRLGDAWSFRVLPIKDDADRQHLAMFMIAALTTYEAQEEGAEVDVDAFLAAFPVESQIRLLLQSVRDTVRHMHPARQTVLVAEEPTDGPTSVVTDASEDVDEAAAEAADHPCRRDDGSVVIPLGPED